MPALIRPSGPIGAPRQFTPVMDDTEPTEHIAYALEHIAVSLAAIDGNVEGLIAVLNRQQRP